MAEPLQAIAGDDFMLGDYFVLSQADGKARTAHSYEELTQAIREGRGGCAVHAAKKGELVVLSTPDTVWNIEA